MQRTRRSVLSGLTFLAIGSAFALGALSYAVGNAARMGPGLFPLLLGVILALLGLAILVRPEEADAESLTRPAWRGLALLLGALLFFGLTIRGLGLGPTVFFTSLLAAFASRETRPLAAVGIAIALTAISLLVFAVALQVPVPILGPWIPRI